MNHGTSRHPLSESSMSKFITGASGIPSSSGGGSPNLWVFLAGETWAAAIVFLLTVTLTEPSGPRKRGAKSTKWDNGRKPKAYNLFGHKQQQIQIDSFVSLPKRRTNQLVSLLCWANLPGESSSSQEVRVEDFVDCPIEYIQRNTQVERYNMLHDILNK